MIEYKIALALWLFACLSWFIVGYAAGARRRKDKSISDDRFACGIADEVEARAERKLDFEERSKLENCVLVILYQEGKGNDGGEGQE